MRADPPPTERWPPLKRQALECLTRGPITGAWNGEWTCATGDHRFNTHTVSWLVSIGCATFDKARTTATITRAGRESQSMKTA
jgi:uncharacterized protein (DUF2237 family)